MRLGEDETGKKREFEGVQPGTAGVRYDAGGTLENGVGVLYHDKDCPCWQRIVSEYPTVNKRRIMR